MLSIRGVTKRFGTLTAVSDLGLEVPAGTVHAFLGPDGAGKSATIRMRTGLRRSDAGAVAAIRGGRDLESASIARTADEEGRRAGVAGAGVRR